MSVDATAFDPATYSSHATLLDGSSILVRAITPDDKERLVEHAKRLSPESVYHRFMSYKRDLSAEELKRFTELDFDQHVGLAAIRNDDGGEHIVGVGRYIRTSNQRAEVAFSVVDELQGHGVGTILLAHLSWIASHSGITEFEADVMGDNVRMLDILTATGFKKQSTYDSGIIHVTMQIDQSTIPDSHTD